MVNKIPPKKLERVLYSAWCSEALVHAQWLILLLVFITLEDLIVISRTERVLNRSGENIVIYCIQFLISLNCIKKWSMYLSKKSFHHPVSFSGHGFLMTIMLLIYNYTYLILPKLFPHATFEILTKMFRLTEYTTLLLGH